MPRLAASLQPFGRPPSRRDWLRLGLPALFSPAALSAADTRAGDAAPGYGRAKSVLVVFTSGGQSQLDTWDPKPDAPEEVRGAFGSAATRVPGTRVCDLMPRLAALADRYAIVRGMTHDDLDHGSACYLALTGQFHPKKSSNPPPRSTDHPALGAVLHRVRPTDRFPHSAFHVNGPLLAPREPGPGQYGGLLGRAYDPPDLGDVTVGTALREAMSLPENVSPERLASRRDLLSEMERGAAADDRLTGAATRLILAGKAYELMESPAIRNAFDLDREPARLRDRYGRYRAGQACLMGRRLVEAGVPWVTVFFNHNIRGQDWHVGETDHYGWDTHNDIFEDMRHHLLPRFDRSVAALIEDMEQRGLLRHTLLVVMGEFGRAPTVAVERTAAGRGAPGRKHWAACYSVVLAGAGVRGGALYGRSDRHAAYPSANAVSPGDLAATLFHALGIDANAHYADSTRRPQRAVAGEPILKLFG